MQRIETQLYLQLSVLLGCLATILFDSVMFRHFMRQRSNLTEAYSNIFSFCEHHHKSWIMARFRACLISPLYCCQQKQEFGYFASGNASKTIAEGIFNL